MQTAIGESGTIYADTPSCKQYFVDELVQNDVSLLMHGKRYVDDELLRGDHAHSYQAAGVGTRRHGQPSLNITREFLESIMHVQ